MKCKWMQKRRVIRKLENKFFLFDYKYRNINKVWSRDPFFARQLKRLHLSCQNTNKRLKRVRRM